MIALAPPRVSVHFTRMYAQGAVGKHEGLEQRTRQQIEHLDEPVRLLAMVKPRVIVMAHTAMSGTLGKAGEAELVERLTKEHEIPFVTAIGCVVAAFAHLGVKRIALGTPYDPASTAKTQALLQAYGIEVVAHGQLEGVGNIYDETAARARELAKRVDTPAAQAVYLSGLGMPTIAELAAMEKDLGKPVVSAAAAMMWHPLRLAGERAPIAGFGRLLAGR